MFQLHRITTPRIARMLRELEGTDTAQNNAADIAKPAADGGVHPPQQWFKAAADLIAASFVRRKRVRSI